MNEQSQPGLFIGIDWADQKHDCYVIDCQGKGFHQELKHSPEEIEAWVAEMLTLADGKPIAILVASLEQGLSLGAMSDRALELADQHWPGAVTLVVPRLDTAPGWLGDTKRGTVALRCPDHQVALDLLELTGPLAVTSANKADNEPVRSSAEAEAIFDGEVLTYLPGEAGGGQPSTLVDLTQPSEVVLRAGPINP